MTKKDLKAFLKKINQLNEIVRIINESSEKREELSKCKTHDEVIKLTKSWGFEIGNRWGDK